MWKIYEKKTPHDFRAARTKEQVERLRVLYTEDAELVIEGPETMVAPAPLVTPDPAPPEQDVVAEAGGRVYAPGEPLPELGQPLGLARPIGPDGQPLPPTEGEPQQLLGTDGQPVPNHAAPQPSDVEPAPETES